MATILTILENPIAGGATVWPYAGISVFGKKGAALFWHNTFSSSIPDRYTRHVACKGPFTNDVTSILRFLTQTLGGDVIFERPLSNY